ncbi:hydrogenase maturation protease [Streptomyces halobius]|uniref:Hydrogenase maturation protease n=1 Tax=Streptomyces halobius TaxID=2879846 RepID=A0ABY4LZK6_9ACTN|nr:hydrogenase maturation protease [Streptomyces halobius]UQA90934.1 hydrogenase maturation protease [Streptomyces halobius]
MGEPPVKPPARTLIAGVGTSSLGDDGFGAETVRRLADLPLPPGAEIADDGVRGVELAYRMLDGYQTVLLIDAAVRGGEPGTLHILDATEPAAPACPQAPALDGRPMTPDTVLALLDTLSAGTGGRCPERVLIVGCEPADVEEGIGLSEPVGAAVDEAVSLILDLLDPERAEGARARRGSRGARAAHP